MTVVCLYILWLTPLVMVIWLAATVRQVPQPILELWSQVIRMPLPLALVAAAVYAYVYAGITLWRVAVWIDAGRRVLATQGATARRPLGLYIRPFAADPMSVDSDSAAVYPFSKQQSEFLFEPFGWLPEFISSTRQHLDGTHLDHLLLRRGALKAQDYVGVIASHLRSEADVVAWPNRPRAGLPSIMGLD